MHTTGRKKDGQTGTLHLARSCSRFITIITGQDTTDCCRPDPCDLFMLAQTEPNGQSQDKIYGYILGDLCVSVIDSSA